MKRILLGFWCALFFVTVSARPELQKIAVLKVVSVVAQEEIDAQFVSLDASTAGAIGLGVFGAMVGGIIDSRHDKKYLEIAEKRLGPYRDSLLDFDFRSIIHASFEAALKKSEVYGSIEYVASANIEDLSIKPNSNFHSAVVELNDGDQLLLLYTQYLFDPHFEVVYVMTRGEIFIDKKRKNFALNRKKIFNLVFQSGSRTVEYTVANEKSRKLKLEEIERDYELGLPEIKLGDRDVYALHKKLDLKKYGKSTYIKWNHPAENGRWCDGHVKNCLSLGLREVSEDLFRLVENKFDMKPDKKSKEQIDVLHSGVATMVLSESAYFLGRDNGYKKYFIPSIGLSRHVYYSLPDMDLVRVLD